MHEAYQRRIFLRARQIVERRGSGCRSEPDSLVFLTNGPIWQNDLKLSSILHAGRLADCAKARLPNMDAICAL